MAPAFADTVACKEKLHYKVCEIFDHSRCRQDQRETILKETGKK